MQFHHAPGRVAAEPARSSELWHFMLSSGHMRVSLPSPSQINQSQVCLFLARCDDSLCSKSSTTLFSPPLNSGERSKGYEVFKSLLRALLHGVCQGQICVGWHFVWLYRKLNRDFLQGCFERRGCFDIVSASLAFCVRERFCGSGPIKQFTHML